MRIDNIRSSSYNNYDSCQWDYYLKYDIGFESKGSIKTDMGTLIHLALEILAKVKKNNHHLLKDKYSDPEYIFEVVWNSKTKEWKDIHNFTEKEYDFCKSSFYKIINSRDNPLLLNILDTEKQFSIEIQKRGFSYEDSNGVKQYLKLRGTIDLITISDANTIRVLDWKSGRRNCWITGKLKEIDDFEKDMQLRIYNLALKYIYPQYKNRLFTINYINDGGPFTVSFDDSDIEKTIDNLRRRFQEIRFNNEPSRLKDDPSRKKDLWKCKYVCQFGKQKDEYGRPVCNTYHNILKDYGIVKTNQILTDISLEGKSLNISDRNNYNHDRMYRGIIK